MYRPTAALCGLLLASAAPAQTCPGGQLSGVVRDTTSAVIPGASVTLSETEMTGPDGRFIFACESYGPHTLTVSSPGFLTYTMKLSLPHPAPINIRMVPSAEASVTVNAEDDLQVAAPGGGNGMVVAGKQLQMLADDPDDLLRQLQQLSAASGGSPGGATISVDGFQDSSTLPPKDSIAYINVSPDLFSAEYREPPFGGGRVEIYTKPGAKNYHGAVFGTLSSSWMNARDPFTLTTGTLGKQRVGFDLSGPIRRQGSNFSLNLEHRAIDETIAVNAIVPDANGNPMPLLDTVPTPQRLWESNARADWQITPKDFAFVSFSANANHFQNQNVGGQTLREAGYDQGSLDYTIRASNLMTISAKLVHQTLASFEHYIQTDVPNATGPAVTVAGYFTGGGSNLGNERDHRSRTEFDDTLMLNTRQHSVKTGVQMLVIHRDSMVPLSFNGSYIYSGAGSNSALQQYQQEQNATEFNNVSGDPHLAFTQLRFAAFFQDTIKFNDHWSAFVGLRYALESDPAVFNGIGPRGGFSYTPDKKQTLVVKAHFGLFYDQYSGDDAQELLREDGVKRVTSLVYNPVVGNPLAGATPIHALRTTAPGFNLGTYAIGDLSVSKDLPFGFNVNVEEVQLRFLTASRTLNINQPLDGNPYGARPFAANLNILQTRSDGTGQGHGEFFGLSNSKHKRAQFMVGVLHLNIRDNNDDNTFFQPQSAYSDAGETVNRDTQSRWQVFGNATVALPYKLSFSTNGYSNGRQPLNLLTGMDNNGDGNFNDRPSFAAPGAAGIATRFGRLTSAVTLVNGAPVAPIPRNLAVLPWQVHLDANLQRAWVLTRNSKADHQQTMTANVRSANFLNHTNVTGEGNVLGSPQFLVPVAADTARRVEFGLRYSF